MKILSLLLIGYLLGSIPTGLWIGKLFYHTNLREHGSGNTGTTNTFRILGIRAGIVVLAIDILKGTLAVLLPIWLGIDSISPLIFGFMAILGHIFPIFAGFKGGKAVATSAGILLGFAPVFLIFLLAVFFIMLYLFSMISLSSVVASFVAIISVLVFPLIDFILTDYDLLFDALIIIIAGFIIIRHKDNMQRIKAKTENLVPFGLNLSKQVPNKSES
ncbi:glycerol-3-phosphate 1-O-acyltransferase PlsY [Streptococcus dentiloxodontae]